MTWITSHEFCIQISQWRTVFSRQVVAKIWLWVIIAFRTHEQRHRKGCKVEAIIMTTVFPLYCCEVLLSCNSGKLVTISDMWCLVHSADPFKSTLSCCGAHQIKWTLAMQLLMLNSNFFCWDTIFFTWLLTLHFKWDQSTALMRSAWVAAGKKVALGPLLSAVWTQDKLS